MTSRLLCNPVFPWPILAAWLLLALLLLALAERRQRQLLAPARRRLLLALRLLCLLLALLCFLNPARVSRQPAPEDFRVAALLDLSRSMERRDCQESRLAELIRVTDSAAWQQLNSRGNGETWSFSSGSLHQPTPPFTPLPGSTAIGEALRQLLHEQPGALPLGAVLLLSDGRSNSGIPPLQAAREFRQRGIPVSCIGIGSHGEPPDVRIRLLDHPLAVPQESDYTLAAEVTSTFAHDLEAAVEWLENGIVSERQSLLLPAGGTATAKLTRRSAISGFRTYAARLAGVPADARPENNLDYITLKIDEPDRRHILFLGGALSWEWRFLQQAVRDNPKLQLAAIIRTGNQHFFRSNLADSETPPEAFPDHTAFYLPYAAVVLDSRAAAAMTPAGVAALRSFVEHRGGGLLVSGPLQPLPEPLRAILPLQESASLTLARATRLELSRDFIFNGSLLPLSNAQRQLPLPAGSQLDTIASARKGARPAASIPPAETPVLNAQLFGAGQTAYFGLEQSWRWHFNADTDPAAPAAFWNTLLLWLARRPQPQLQPLHNGSKVGLDEPFALDLTVMGSDFLPADEAQVSAEIIEPDGSRHELRLEAELQENGLYSGVFAPRQPGEHRVAYTVRLADRTLETETVFLARPLSAELNRSEFDEETLRSLAAMTGGNYWTPEEFLRKKPELPLNPALHSRLTTTPLLPSWWFLAPLLLAYALHWWFRRRLGLR